MLLELAGVEESAEVADKKPKPELGGAAASGTEVGEAFAERKLNPDD